MATHARAAATQRLIEATDFLRLPCISAVATRSAAPYKEWHHFLIQDGEHLLLVNFSVSEEPLAVDGPCTWVGRLTWLECNGTTFRGDMLVFPSERLRLSAGALHVGFGANAIRFENGRYELSLELEDGDTLIELTLVPGSPPVLTNNLSLAPGRPLCWLAVHRLAAWGLVRHRGTTRHLRGAPAYHDHNWGRFAWGDDFTWEWGTLLAEGPVGLSLVRLTDRARSRSTLRSIQLWHGAEVLHAFQDEEVVIEHHGRARPSHVFKRPGPMALLHPDTALDVPVRIEIVCRSEDASLRMSLELRALAQLLMPDELGRDTVTVLNQCVMDVTLDARVRGTTIHTEAPGVVELIRA